MAGDEYLRLSAEYSAIDKTRSQQYKAKAQMEYVKAKDYTKSINLLLDIASDKTKSSDVYPFYRLAWSLADSVGYHDKADSLKSAFVSRYPATKEAYLLRLDNLDVLSANKETALEAAQGYLSLYNDVVAKRIDSGQDQPELLYLNAISMYDKAGDDLNKEKYVGQFLSEYPKHKDSVILMEYLADRKLAIGDTLAYASLSKSIYQKDKSHQTRYVNLAKIELGKIATDFQTAYANRDWDNVNKSISDFKKLHQRYKQEGLNLNFDPVYDDFKLAESDYKLIEVKLAQQKQIRQQIRAFETGFLAKKPSELISVNVNTRWQANLAGKLNRIDNVVKLTGQEVKKARQLLVTATDNDLDTELRLQIFDLIGRLADHGSNAISTQIDRYMSVSREFATYKKQYANSIDDLLKGINDQRARYVLEVQQMSFPFNMAVYRYFYIPGSTNPYAKNSFERLTRMNALPDYVTELMFPKDGWNSFVSSLDSANPVPTGLNIMENASIGGIQYSKVLLPANCQVVLNGVISATGIPEYAYARIIDPSLEDIEISLDDSVAEFSYNVINRVQTDGNTRDEYALVFAENILVAGNHRLKLSFKNYSAQPKSVYLSIHCVDKAVQNTDNATN